MRERALQDQYVQMEGKIRGEFASMQSKWEEQKRQYESIQASYVIAYSDYVYM